MARLGRAEARPAGLWPAEGPEGDEGMHRRRRVGSGRAEDGEAGALQRLGHDLRQPAAAISMLAAVAELHPDVPDEVRDRLGQIRSEARRISDVCRYLLGELDGFELADLSEIAGQVVASARVTCAMAIDLVDAPVVVRANSVDVWRALANLVENACRAAGTEGRVVVKVVASSEGAQLEVHDSGPGWGEGPAGTASLGLSIVGSSTDASGGRLETGTSELGGAVARLVFTSVIPAYLDLIDDPTTAAPVVQ
jgi:signal transduction histidine kinase